MLDHATLLPISPSPNIIINNKLLYLWCMHLMSLVLALNVEGSGRHVLHLSWCSTKSACLEVVHGFVHVVLPVLAVAEVDT